MQNTRYKIGSSIICEDVRLISHTSNRFPYCFFHHTIVANVNNIKVTQKIPGKGLVSFIPKHITKDCENMDESGFCRGHPISKKEFIQQFCDGIEPPEPQEPVEVKSPA